MNLFILFSIIILISLSSAYDIKFRRIPNFLTYPAVLTGLAYHSYTAGFEGFQFSIYGTLTGVGLLIIPYISGKMGAGDAKLLGAVGSFIGAKYVFIAFLFTAVTGGILALLILLLNNQKFKTFFPNFYNSGLNPLVIRKDLSFRNNEDIRPRPNLCYGLAIATGTGIFMICAVIGIEVFPL